MRTYITSIKCCSCGESIDLALNDDGTATVKEDHACDFSFWEKSVSHEPQVEYTYTIEIGGTEFRGVWK